MARNITKSELRSFVTISLESANLIKSSSQAEGATVFLSHSSKDTDLVPGSIKVLKNHGATVYIDEIDPEMPPYTSSETAALIKTRIRQTKRFVLLTSDNSKDSKWVPWELGIADGEKGISSIALFPASDSQYLDSWTSWEYLGLYERIVWGKLNGYNDELWMVLNHKKNTAVPLRDWLSGR
ncbi:hypothetical protein BJP27_10120 [Pseudomonas oryzihabitans]|nr:hypothetical protein BJP27_10120 [Pseudomonas psychrotolerans]